jgi:hypothetical protein
MLTAEETVRGLVAQGVPLEVAQEQARRMYPEMFSRQAERDERDARVLEKAEQAVIVKMARASGGRVYSLSQSRATKQTPGLPDLWIMYPKWVGFWWETKRQVGGDRSPAQIEFGEECAGAGVEYGYGDRHAFAAFLRLHNIPSPLPPL